MSPFFFATTILLFSNLDSNGNIDIQTLVAFILSIYLMLKILHRDEMTSSLGHGCICYQCWSITWNSVGFTDTFQNQNILHVDMYIIAL